MRRNPHNRNRSHAWRFHSKKIADPVSTAGRVHFLALATNSTPVRTT